MVLETLDLPYTDAHPHPFYPLITFICHACFLKATVPFPEVLYKEFGDRLKTSDLTPLVAGQHNLSVASKS